MRRDLGRLMRFGLTGLVTTGIAYFVFIGLLKLELAYLPAAPWAASLPAATVAWAASLVVGFVINRRFTFGIVGAGRYGRDFGLYLTGAILQLLVSWPDYAFLIGQLRLGPTLAFVVNTAIVTAFGFLFMRFITFRRAAHPASPP